MSQSVFPNLVADDLEATIAWYQQNLNAVFKMSVPSQADANKACFATLTLADNDIMLQTPDNLAEKYPVLAGSISKGNGVALNIQVADAQAVFDGLVDRTGIVAEPADTFYGMREFTLKDPNGYLLTIASFVAQDR